MVAEQKRKKKKEVPIAAKKAIVVALVLVVLMFMTSGWYTMAAGDEAEDKSAESKAVDEKALYIEEDHASPEIVELDAEICETINDEDDMVIEQSVAEEPLEAVKESAVTLDYVKTNALYNDQDVIAVSLAAWGEYRGYSDTEVAAVVWCILNRVDSQDPYFPDTIYGVVTQSLQFHGYKPYNPVDERIKAIVIDVFDRWCAEKAGAVNVGRVLPQDYLYFTGDGRHNSYTTVYQGTDYWNWSLPSPYDT